VLTSIAVIRELMGFGTLLGFQILGEWWTPWTIMVMAPSAFFVLAILIWVAKSITEKPEVTKTQTAKKEVQASGN
jgi:Na+-transporting NADH:ubiquinone oxidoreductase subunit D